MDFMRNFFFQIVSYYNISLGKPASIFPYRVSLWKERMRPIYEEQQEMKPKHGKRAIVLLDLAITELHL